MASTATRVLVLRLALLLACLAPFEPRLALQAAAEGCAPGGCCCAAAEAPTCCAGEAVPEGPRLVAGCTCGSHPQPGAPARHDAQPLLCAAGAPAPAPAAVSRHRAAPAPPAPASLRCAPDPPPPRGLA
jgi:hypothetical protein